jgi:hypothetical protein
MLDDAAIEIALDAIAAQGQYLRLHDAYPGTTFDNELTSPYTVGLAIAWDAASGRTATQDGTAGPFTVDGDVAWYTLSTGEDSGSQLAKWPADGDPQEFTVDPATDVFTKIGHGWSNNQKVVFYGTSVPGALTAGVVYFVRDATTDTFKVESSIGGGAIDITSRPSDDGALVSPITIYSGGTRPFSVTGLVLAINA